MPIPTMTRETGSPEAPPCMQAVAIVLGDATQEALRQRPTFCGNSLLILVALPIPAFFLMMTPTLFLIPAILARNRHRAAPRKV